mmetsp:Transcript_73658/g.162647  ORF Transcript_73658/g.162647 Transcript_73658/m.162647 type:complete len:83 (-) Transcript_73658:256-504(-)
MSGRNVAACEQHPYRPMFKQDIAVSHSHHLTAVSAQIHNVATAEPLFHSFITPKQSHAHEVRLKHVDYTGTGARMPATCSAS